MKITREIKTAVLVILSVLLFYWGFNFLKGSDMFNKTQKIYVTYDDVAGLAQSSPVTLNGLIIGKVNKFYILEGGKMRVEMEIVNPDVSISKNAVAEIRGLGLTGPREIALLNNFSDKNYIVSGDEIKPSTKLALTDAFAKELLPVKTKVEDLLTNANALISNLNATLDATTQQKLKASIASLEVTMAEFTKISKGVNGILDDNKTKLNTTLTNFEKTSSNLNSMTASLEKAQLGETVKKLETTLTNVNAIMANLEQGKGTMGKLLNDDAMYTNLTKTSKELELLLQDLRLNPTRYVNVSVFGKKNKPYVEPTETNNQPKK